MEVNAENTVENRCTADCRRMVETSHTATFHTLAVPAVHTAARSFDTTEAVAEFQWHALDTMLAFDYAFLHLNQLVIGSAVTTTDLKADFD